MTTAWDSCTTAPPAVGSVGVGVAVSSLTVGSVTAVGPDDIHYQMLKHLPTSAMGTLLSVLNNIWLSGNFPSSWRTSTVIPVLKPGKQESDPGSYRPIALTSCICKIMAVSYTHLTLPTNREV